MSEPRYCVPGCTGHLGKFEDCVTEALYDMSMTQVHDNETGNVDWDVWVAYFSWFGPGHPPYQVDAGWVGIPAGNYLLFTNDRGFVWSRHYATDTEARQEFDRIDGLYCEWEDRED